MNSASERQGLPPLLQQFTRYLPSFVGAAGTALVSLMVLTRVLAPSQYGELVLCVAIVTVTTAVLGDWLNLSYLRMHSIAQDQAQLSELDRTYRRLGVFTVALATTVAGVAILLSLGLDFAVAGASAVAAQLALRYRLVHERAALRAGKYSLASSGAAIVGSGLGLVGVLILSQPWVFIAGQAIGQLGVLVVLRRGSTELVVRSDGTTHVTEERRPAATALLRYGIPIALTAVASQALLLADRFIIQGQLGSDSLAGYYANYAIPDRAVGLIVGPLVFAFQPLLFRQVEHFGSGDRKAELGPATGLVIALAFPTVMALCLFPSQISRLVVGQQYVTDARVIPLVAVGAFLWAIGSIVNQVFETALNTRLITTLVAVAAVVNVTANLWLIPHLGVMGAAWATLVSYAFYLAAATTVAVKFFGGRVAPSWRALLPPVVASVAALGVWAHLASGARDSTQALVALALAGGFAVAGGIYLERTASRRH